VGGRDGAWVLLAKNRDGAFRLFRQPTSGGADELVRPAAGGNAPVGGKQIPTHWSTDGTTMLFEEAGDIWMVRRGKSAPERLIAGPSEESDAHLSPDGRWVAYSSDVSGRREVYVAPTSFPERRSQISPLGGHSPTWRHDGQEIFYVSADRTLSAVPVHDRDGSLVARAPVALFAMNVEPLASRTYVPDSRGQKFLVNEQVRSAGVTMRFVVNWVSR
jgi:Tol biopolymer transport system component